MICGWPAQNLKGDFLQRNGRFGWNRHNRFPFVPPSANRQNIFPLAPPPAIGQLFLFLPNLQKEKKVTCTFKWAICVFLQHLHFETEKTFFFFVTAGRKRNCSIDPERPFYVENCPVCVVVQACRKITDVDPKFYIFQLIFLSSSCSTFNFTILLHPFFLKPFLQCPISSSQYSIFYISAEKCIFIQCI